MIEQSEKPADHDVGHGKPPIDTRFKKGQSGNPRGRPRKRPPAQIAEDIILAEAYRTVTVREGEKTVRLPAIAAVMRSQLALAVKGNGPAQRAYLAKLESIENARGALDRELLKEMIEYKARAEREIAQRRKIGITDISDINPHPDEILIDAETGKGHFLRDLWPKDAAILRALKQIPQDK